ncbi:hypothetical protein M8868_09250 [Pasteurella multocida]|uniref:Uncharacterized protein n=2 Tax=Irtavirus TaxID=2732981 RepID=A0AAF0B8E0_9CAUD|nr:hypothetical protein [Pasteurella multocida]YP_654721.1 hypothetical protein F108p10 [Pasteurella phage F108]WBY65442.1 hypothetical protein FP3_000011 [Pasteurella phage vB_PmuM_CFP3]AAZ93646.1 unknown [Pasteurella phage F108]ARA69473.1 hypothetical protein BTV67_02590 [Pasteurella multocida subsp. multocida]ARA89185.1 hypothetical protein BTV66_06120 [Pasteurella multocida subsp. septica]MCL7761437.1 hypothetical protein [Pasteurella multocida]
MFPSIFRKVATPEVITMQKREDRTQKTYPEGKFVLLRKSSAFGWESEVETREGMDAQTIERVYFYKVEIERRDPRNLIIVKVE